MPTAQSATCSPITLTARPSQRAATAPEQAQPSGAGDAQEVPHQRSRERHGRKEAQQPGEAQQGGDCRRSGVGGVWGLVRAGLLVRGTWAQGAGLTDRAAQLPLHGTVCPWHGLQSTCTAQAATVPRCGLAAHRGGGSAAGPTWWTLLDAALQTAAPPTAHRQAGRSRKGSEKRNERSRPEDRTWHDMTGQDTWPCQAHGMA